MNNPTKNSKKIRNTHLSNGGSQITNRYGVDTAKQ
jgi:hypothetical protein